MSHRKIPAYCAECGAAIPRAAAGRCPSCRVEFAPAGVGARPPAHGGLAAPIGRPAGSGAAAPRLPGRRP